MTVAGMRLAAAPLLLPPLPWPWCPPCVGLLARHGAPQRTVRARMTEMTTMMMSRRAAAALLR